MNIMTTATDDLAPVLASREVTQDLRKNWRALAACQLVDPELFFPLSAAGKSLEQIADAKAVCSRCPVRRQCLEFARRTHQPYGIWGGLNAEERFGETCLSQWASQAAAT